MVVRNFNAGKSRLQGTPTAHIGVGGTDLGFLFEGGKQFDHPGRTSMWVGGIFGDTFDGFPTPGNHWRSPVMMRSGNTDFARRGIVWDNAARGGKGILSYPMGIKNGDPRRRDQGCYTIIPNDVIQLPDHQYMGMGFRVRNWDANPAAGQHMCHTHSNTWFRSTEPHAETWEFATDLEAPNQPGFQWWNSGRDQFFQNATFLMVPGDDHVYVFGTPEGRYAGADKAGVYLRRCDWRHLWERSRWEYWGFKDGRWQWGRGVAPTPILKPTTPGTPIGEINAQYLGGKVRLTYIDGALGAVCRTADRPDTPWSHPVIMVTGVTAGAQMMYAPSLHPWNTNMQSAALNISSWIHYQDKFDVVYGTYTYTANIDPVLPLAGRSKTALSEDTWEMTDGEREDYISKIAKACADANRCNAEEG
ncbi:DUF4185 domain-containing protein [Corynebacterium sphenisci]|uniref:DUF4185 domain-containing protein n=1 Tax=Corynebacterium sphenisci TaxID=191493 RepID=UPI0026E10B6E|nr:DUF4185 domain-containing protein [Corynebacterium sphenisci]MDO5730764.1 DUF4185 domain-containing protein [Corynebacterium sphenisci]